MAAMIGRLYFHRGRASEARRFLAQAREQASPLSALVIAQRAKLTAAERQQLSSARCELSPEAGLEAHAEAAAAHAAKGARVASQACANAVLPSLLDTLDMVGKAAQLDGDVPTALAAHEQALALDPWAPESLFARSALLYETRGEDPKALVAAREGLKLYVEKHPQGPRLATALALLSRVEGAVKAGGVKAFLASERKARLARVAKELPTTANRSGGTPMVAAAAPVQAPSGAGGELPQLTPEMVEAVQNTERTPELEAGLAKLVEEGEEHLARGRFQEALAAYRRVVPFQPQNGRAQAGMAWAMIGLGRGPMAERIWGVAVQGSPQAVDALGDTLKAKGNAEAARAVWTKLSQTDATYAARAGLPAKMK
jgi:tetratricopeptide (TPR) repeat protein